MIENLGVVSVWATRTSPPDSIYKTVVEWIIAAEMAPWRAPSRPDGPAGPVQRRTVLLADVEVNLVYLTEHATGVLTVLEVDEIRRVELPMSSAHTLRATGWQFCRQLPAR